VTVLQVFGATDFDVPDDLAFSNKHSLGIVKLSSTVEHQVHAFGINHDLNKGVAHLSGERIPEDQRVYPHYFLDGRRRFVQYHLSQRQREFPNAQIKG